jgi:hypothetical protein
VSITHPKVGVMKQSICAKKEWQLNVLPTQLLKLVKPNQLIAAKNYLD